MKIQPTVELRKGYLLIEVLVYISVVMVLLGVGYAAMYKCINTSLALRRSSEDISRALKTIELWRQDVRNASVARQETGPQGGELLLEGRTRTNAYRFSGTNICRKTDSGSWVVILSNVKASDMEPLQIPNVDAWRWNFELKIHSKSRILPLFTGTAVQAATEKTP